MANLNEAILEVLENADDGLTAREVYDALKEKGHDIGGKTPLNRVYSRLPKLSKKIKRDKQEGRGENGRAVYVYGEIKTDKKLKEYYFQALSNSSWANEGYLVSLNFNEGLKDELIRLHQSFGMGFIKLNAKNLFESEVLIKAKYKKELDFNTIDKISTNEDYKKFIEKITLYMNADKSYEGVAKKDVESICDDVLTKVQMEEYCQTKGIE